MAIDQLGKKAFSLPYYKIAIITNIAQLYYKHVWKIFKIPEIIISD